MKRLTPKEHIKKNRLDADSAAMDARTLFASAVNAALTADAGSFNSAKDRLNRSLIMCYVLAQAAQIGQEELQQQEGAA